MPEPDGFLEAAVVPAVARTTEKPTPFSSLNDGATSTLDVEESITRRMGGPFF